MLIISFMHLALKLLGLNLAMYIYTLSELNIVKIFFSIYNCVYSTHVTNPVNGFSNNAY